MKLKKLFALALAGSVMTCCLTACGGDEPDSPVQQESGNGNGENNRDDGGASDGSLSLAQVKSHSKVSSTYNKYRYKVTATYTPVNGENADFEWCVSRSGSQNGYSFSGGGITSSTVTNGGKRVFTLEFPMFLYYVMRSTEDPYNLHGNWSDKSATAEWYLETYDALSRKESSGQKLSSEELQLRKEIVAELDNMAREIRSDFSIWLYVVIDGKKFNLGENKL